MVETKHERFRRLAKSRGDRMLREIRLLGNLSNRKNYDFQDEDIEALFGPIEAQLQEVKKMFGSDAGQTPGIRFE